MDCKRTDCLSKHLSRLFERLGFTVGSHPLYFFIIPIIVSLALGGGFVFLRETDNDLETQFTPKKGPSKAIRAFVSENFPYDYSMFSEERLYNQGNFASLIAESTTTESVLEHPVFQDVIKLNEMILNITVDNIRKGFNELCVKVNGTCFANPILEIASSEKPVITYPTHVHESSSVFLGSVLGGLTLDANSTVIHAKAIKLHYYLNDQDSTEETTKVWQREFQDLLSSDMKGKNIDVFYYTSKSKQDEIDSHATDGFPLFLITYACAITLSVISCLRRDMVRSKIWVAFFGVISSGLAVVSSFGLLLYLKVPFVITVANSPFLILGIGLNNMFIMVLDWQHSHVKDSVPTRMAHTYKEAVMSITITALTDILKFFIGVMNDFASVQYFCLYTATAIFFSYIYTITFLGAFMALNGMREGSNRHWLTCMKLPSNKTSKTKLYNFFCVGGDYDHTTGAEKKNVVSTFFKKFYGPFLMKSWVKALVVLLYVGYVGFSVFGCFQIKQGIELYDLASDDSPIRAFTIKDQEYFSDYGPSIMVVVSEEFPYWEKLKRDQLRECVENFKGPKFVDSEIFTSWLDSYLAHGQQMGLNLNDKEVFLSNLPLFFHSNPFFKQDVNLTGEAIHASRFFIQTVNISDATKEMEMLYGLRSIAKRCTVAPLMVYNHKFIYYDQYGVVVKGIIKNVGVITAVMLVVSLLFIPNPICSLLVTCSIGSVTVGVTGFMALWHISLDSISMIIFTVCIGFTVDFSAHVSYAFVNSKKPSRNEKAVDAIANLGYPILQAVIATVVGLSVLSVSEFHTFRMFFKIFLLVMVIGMVHGLVFMPVILTICTCSSEKKQANEKDVKVSKL